MAKKLAMGRRGVAGGAKGMSMKKGGLKSRKLGGKTSTLFTARTIGKF